MASLETKDQELETVDQGKTTVDLPIVVTKTSIFDTLYAQLNPQQKQAVDTIEGPVMVIAGPGTGKTQVLTLRIANILRKTQMNPRNILALTFTDNAAANMRKRLISIIGPTAYQVSIHTFHGFANSVIGEFPHKFQFAKELEQVDEIEQIEILEQLIDDLPLSELRPVKAPYHYLREMLSRISELKRENITPNQLNSLASENIENLTEDSSSYHEKGAHKGKMKAAVAEEIKHLTRCKELATVYGKYQDALTTRGRYDYDDMILFVIKQFETDYELKAYYQERYQYILVDEYQDTNNAQNRLVELVADFFESPNLFVVGDDKQSIFRFQGASMANMLSLYHRYSDVQVISLQSNYRSNQCILDNSHRVITKTNNRITHFIPDIRDLLKADNPKTSTLPPINLGVFDSRQSEQYWVVKKIQSLIDSGVNPLEIAIIYKENSEAEPFAELLARTNIPYALERGSDVLTDTDIRRLLTMLVAVVEPTNSRALFELLHYDFTGIAGIDVLKLLSYRATHHLSIIDTLENLPCACGFHNFKDKGAVTFTHCQALTDTYNKLGDWRLAMINKPLPGFVEQVMRESGLLKQITESPTRIERLHRLSRFFDEIKRCSSKKTTMSCVDFLDHIQRLIDNRIQLVPDPLELSSDTSGSLRLLTAHKAKGLEFTHVFLPNVCDKHWGNKATRIGIRLPHTIVEKDEEVAADKNEDDCRLFYVAMTRAKECLYITYAKSHNGKEILPSQFLSELNTEETVLIDTASVQKDAQLLASFEPILEINFTDEEKEYLKILVKESPINPTGLNNYLRCHQDYLFKNLLRVPGAKAAQLGYGTAIHAALQQLYLKHRLTKQFISLPELLQFFEDSLSKEILTPADYNRYLIEGKDTLTKYYDTQLSGSLPTVAVEYSFNNHSVVLPGSEIGITGKLDKLELLDARTNSVRIIDYKTTQPKSRNAIEGRTAADDGDYKRQLVFYQLLSQLDPQFPYNVVETGLTFIGKGGECKTEYFTITKQEVEELKELIQIEYAKMLDLQFEHIPPPPNRPPCDFCNM